MRLSPTKALAAVIRRRRDAGNGDVAGIRHRTAPPRARLTIGTCNCLLLPRQLGVYCRGGASLGHRIDVIMKLGTRARKFYPQSG